MDRIDFNIVNDNGAVSIVRAKKKNSKKGIQLEQKMRVMCFDSAQIDRIFHFQEQSVNITISK